jgi:EAL domain-containing protein (putative c-di-GMP-specific phosphodiesterase class I)/CRP-like cAMP-binding protein
MSAINIEHEIPDLSNQSGLVTFSAGSRIFEEEEKGSEAYLIQEGYVEISKFNNNQKTVIALLGPGEIFGEITAMDGKLRTATATAVHEALLLPISRKQLYDVLNNGDPLSQLLLQSLIRRLRGMHDEKNNDEEENELNTFLDKDVLYLEVQKKAVNHVNAITKLSKAVENRQFELNYQPIINLSTGVLNGFEVLVRGPKYMPEFFSPLTFIPLAEESGLIVPLGEWILEYGLKAFQLFENEAKRRAHTEELFISVNVSPRQLEDQNNVEKLIDIISRSSVSPERIKLEITESTLLSDPQSALIALNRLNSIGLSISIDDFGTGYSSLNYLNRFPLSTLKIDRSFVKNIFNDESSSRIVSAIIGLAHQLEMDVVAEGVETKRDQDWLTNHGCEYGQGYYFAKPMSLQDSINIMNKKFS